MTDTAEPLRPGLSVEVERRVEAADVERFAEVSGDRNPLHLDEAYAAQTPFGGPIAHGMLTAAFISAVLGERLPGPGTVYLSQTLRFKRPVRPGDTVTVSVAVAEIDAETGEVTLDTVCKANRKVVVEGRAVVLPPKARG